MKQRSANVDEVTEWVGHIKQLFKKNNLTLSKCPYIEESTKSPFLAAMKTIFNSEGPEEQVFATICTSIVESNLSVFMLSRPALEKLVITNPNLTKEDLEKINNHTLDKVLAVAKGELLEEIHPSKKAVKNSIRVAGLCKVIDSKLRDLINADPDKESELIKNYEQGLSRKMKSFNPEQEETNEQKTEEYSAQTENKKLKYKFDYLRKKSAQTKLENT